MVYASPYCDAAWRCQLASEWVQQYCRCLYPATHADHYLQQLQQVVRVQGNVQGNTSYIAPCRLWSPADLSLHRTIVNGPAWVTDCVYMPTARRLVCASADRAVSTFSCCMLTDRVHGLLSNYPRIQCIARSLAILITVQQVQTAAYRQVSKHHHRRCHSMTVQH